MKSQIGIGIRQLFMALEIGNVGCTYLQILQYGYLYCRVNIVLVSSKLGIIFMMYIGMAHFLDIFNLALK